MACRGCNGICAGCKQKVYVNTVTFTDGTLILTLPATTSYDNYCKYCFVITTALPDGITRDAPVVAIVEGGTVQFPLLTICGAQVLEQQINTRQRYPFRVATSAAGGSLTILRPLPIVETTTLAALNDAEAPADGGGGGA